MLQAENLDGLANGLANATREWKLAKRPQLAVVPQWERENLLLRLCNETMFRHGYRVVECVGKDLFRVDLPRVSDPKIVRLI